MKTEIDISTELSPLTPIRVETALSRQPIHRLAKKGDIEIDIHEKNAKGETTLKWRVTYNSGFGQPGPLAYKLDTLIINRRIEEAPRPLPKLIRLGSQRDICRELGLNEGKATKDVKNALHQNASAYITAKIRFRAIDGGEQDIELGDTRYAVIFTGQVLPNGQKADAVYIELHDRYREILNKAITRPLDYDYLKSLPPAPQRFYEILSYQMHAALKYDRSRAKLTYSELCTHAPQKRHVAWEKVRSQMNKIHRPHKASGYIGKVDFHQTTDALGQADWIIHYMPGPKARADFLAFTKRNGEGATDPEPTPFEPLPLLDAIENIPIEAELTKRGVSSKIAAELVKTFPPLFIEAKIEEFDWAMRQPKPPKKPVGYLVNSIRDGYSTDPNFVSTAEQNRQKENELANEREKAEEKRLELEQEAARKAERQAINAYRKGLTAAELAELEANALTQTADVASRQLLEKGCEPVIRRMLLGTITDSYILGLLRQQVEPA